MTCRAQRTFCVLHDQSSLVEVERLVSEQRDDVGAELTVGGGFRQAERGEEVALGQRLLVCVVGAHTGEGCESADRAVQVAAELVVVGGAEQWGGVLGQQGGDAGPDWDAADSAVHLLVMRSARRSIVTSAGSTRRSPKRAMCSSSVGSPTPRSERRPSRQHEGAGGTPAGVALPERCGAVDCACKGEVTVGGLAAHHSGVRWRDHQPKSFADDVTDHLGYWITGDGMVTDPSGDRCVVVAQPEMSSPEVQLLGEAGVRQSGAVEQCLQQ